jgi:phosphoenolpyruvate synthase/pyruvate phosphate dikinase
MSREPIILRGQRAVDISARSKAYIVRDFSAPQTVPAGAILVARHASPDAILAMERAGGLVFETGGPASHAAILARELGVACVVGVAGALEAIRDGDEVSINGATGEVRVVAQ